MYPDKLITPPPIELHSLVLDELEDEGEFRSMPLAGFLPYILIGILILVSYWGISELGPGVRRLFDRLGALAPVSSPMNQIPANHSAASVDRISPLFTEEVQHWNDEIIRWSNTYRIDPNMVAVVMQIESCGHPTVESNAGANGLFQVMPFHFEAGENPIHPETNALRGLNYLHDSLRLSEGNPALALAGYNGGHGVIFLPSDQWADETQRYVYWGTGILKDINSGNLYSPTLNDWLHAGGQSLCKQAAQVLLTNG